MMPYLPNEKSRSIRRTRDTIASVAAEVMIEKRNDMSKGLSGGKDLMSLLLRANAGESKQQRMSDDEVNAVIVYVCSLKGFLPATHTRARSAVIVAGCTFYMRAGNPSCLTVLPDTNTASTLAFALLELAKSPETQRRVRDEILAAKGDVSRSAGTDQIPFDHYEKMPLLIALIKVYHSSIMNVDDGELTFEYEGDTQNAPGHIHDFQGSGRG